MSGNTSATGGFLAEIPPPPITGRGMTLALQAAVVAITGLPGTLVRPRWQPMPPTQPPVEVTWCSIGITHIEAHDYPVITHDGTTQLVGAPGPGVDRLRRHMTQTVVATFYGPESEDVAGMFRDGMYIQQNWEPLHLVGARLREVGDLARVPETINQQWVDRFDIRLEMEVQIERVYPVLNIDGADVVLHVPPCPDELITVREDTEVRP